LPLISCFFHENVFIAARGRLGQVAAATSISLSFLGNLRYAISLNLLVNQAYNSRMQQDWLGTSWKGGME
jgi:hypothetical protein